MELKFLQYYNRILEAIFYREDINELFGKLLLFNNNGSAFRNIGV